MTDLGCLSPALTLLLRVLGKGAEGLWPLPSCLEPRIGWGLLSIRPGRWHRDLDQACVKGCRGTVRDGAGALNVLPCVTPAFQRRTLPGEPQMHYSLV